MQQHHYLFYGRVQGVGFRYTLQMLANDRGVKGWVKNLADGSVEAVIQGQKEIVDEILEILESRFTIENIKVYLQKHDGKYRTFEIKK